MVTSNLCGVLLNLVASTGVSRPLAYLDPGTGSYIIQLLIAGVLGAAFMLRGYWKNVKGFFAGLFSKGGSKGDALMTKGQSEMKGENASSNDAAQMWLQNLSAGKEEEIRAQATVETQARVDEILGRKSSPPEGTDHGK